MRTTLVRTILLPGLLAALLLGCASSKTNEPSTRASTQPAASDARSGDATDALAGGDARRAQEAMEARDAEPRGQKPAAPPTRGGTGIVDQPRPGARP